MKKKIKYRSKDLGKIEVVRDFLPPPEELVLKDDTVKITLNLSRSSVDFFKDLAGRNNIQYQKLIRKLLDQYVSKFT